MATRSVRAESDSVESAAEFRLVFGVPHQRAQLVKAVSKLTLVAVLARPVLFKWTAQLRLVPARIALRRLDLLKRKN